MKTNRKWVAVAGAAAVVAALGAGSASGQVPGDKTLPEYKAVQGT